MRLALPCWCLLLALPAAVDAAPAAYGGSGMAELAPLARQVADALQARWPDATPEIDAALSAAAAELAGQAAGGAALEAITQQESVRLAQARAGAHAPELAPQLIRASSRALALERLRERLAQQEEPPQLVGIAAAERDGSTTLVLLRASKRAELEPFPSTVETGSRHRLAGRVLPPLRAAAVYVTPPGGKPARLARSSATSFTARAYFPEPGRYTLEVVGEGPQGPEVAALLDVWAGQPIPAAAATRATEAPEPERVEEKERLAAELVAGLRRERGLPALRIDPTLAKVARSYARELLRSGELRHRSPTSGDLADRLAKAGYRFRSAGENLAQAPTVREAHRSTVRSPGHLANLVERGWSEAGFGVARGTTPSGQPTVILVEIFAAPAR